MVPYTMTRDQGHIFSHHVRAATTLAALNLQLDINCTPGFIHAVQGAEPTEKRRLWFVQMSAPSRHRAAAAAARLSRWPGLHWLCIKPRGPLVQPLVNPKKKRK